MRDTSRKIFAVFTGLLLVGTAALGGTMMQPGVNSVDDAANQYVERGEGQVALGAGIVVGAAAYYTYENYIKNSPNTNAEELAKTDALETKKEIYDQASIQKQNNDLTSTAYSNYLNDTESIALMEGKNAYIRALENGSAESVARNQAIEAVSNYYAVKQQNLIAAWNTTVTVMNSSRATAENTSNVDTRFVRVNLTGDWFSENTPYSFDASGNVTLVNASTEPVQAVYASVDTDAEMASATFGPSGIISSSSNSGHIQNAKFEVMPPNSNYEKTVVADASDFGGRWTEIEQQNDDVQSQVDTFINNTYDSYQQGDINTSDLVDPYLGAREYSPETSDTWTLRTLSAMGMDTPENLSNIGRMNVTANGNTYTGVLMSDGTPSGGYVVGETYNATNLTGAQFVATDDGDAVELDGNFTLDSARTTDGDVYADGETVEYKTVNYQTANTSEFKALQEDLDELTADINARQQSLRAGAGGSGLGQNAIIAIVVLAGAALYVNNKD